MTETRTERHDASPVDALVKALPVVAVLLPAVGALVRVIAFAADPRITIQTSVAASVADLATEGARSFLVSLPYLAFYYLFFSRVAKTAAKAMERDERLDALERTAKFDSEEHQRLLAEWGPLKGRADALAARSEALKQQLAGGVSPTAAAAVAQFEADSNALTAELAAHASAENDIATRFKNSEAAISEVQRLTEELRTVYPRWFFRTMHVLVAPLDRPFAALQKRPMLRIVAGVGWYGVLAALMPGFPWMVVALVGAWIAGYAFDHAARRIGRLTVGSVWPAVLVLLASGAISYGLQPYEPRASYVRFAANLGYPAGWYALLGRDADTLYLRPCDPNVPYMLSVRADLVPSIQTLPSRSLDSPNAIGYLTGTPVAVGISRTCGPHPDTP